MIHAFCRPVEQITTLDVLWGLVLLGLLISQAFGPLAYPQPVHMLHLAHHPAELPRARERGHDDELTVQMPRGGRMRHGL